MKRLTTEQRHVFDLVRQAVRANPFSRERQEINRNIAGFIGATEADTLERTISDVSQRMEAMAKSGLDRVGDYGDGDADLLRYAHLFHLFHRYIDDFDAHIETQEHRGAQPTPLPDRKSVV